jgi:hypothetical protein
VDAVKVVSIDIDDSSAAVLTDPVCPRFRITRNRDDVEAQRGKETGISGLMSLATVERFTGNNCLDAQAVISI